MADKQQSLLASTKEDQPHVKNIKQIFSTKMFDKMKVWILNMFEDELLNCFPRKSLVFDDTIIDENRDGEQAKKDQDSDVSDLGIDNGSAKKEIRPTGYTHYKKNHVLRDKVLETQELLTKKMETEMNKFSDTIKNMADCKFKYFSIQHKTTLSDNELTIMAKSAKSSNTAKPIYEDLNEKTKISNLQYENMDIWYELSVYQK